ncbi:MAG TPA: endo alpha-1,4 polygalactosaminidase [Pilimelia sp.]|nr:endo alpha-1,4 polygalactosaminidase [Pilimelia sp.]
MTRSPWLRRALAAVLAALSAVTVGAVPASAAPTWWRPAPGLTWQWQLSGTLDTAVAAAVYDVDAVETTRAQVATLHAKRRKVICYVNAGAWENWRPDRGRFPAAVLGKPLDGWAGERWLDIRRWDVLQSIMKARLQVCAAKGFDGVEPDNVDGYANRSGFPLTGRDQLTYNRRVAALAHSLGLAVGLKNDVEQAAALAPAFDFAVNEECAAYRECAALKVFIAAGKPVFHVEYALATTAFCPTTRALRFSSMRKGWSLGRWRQPC